MGTPLFVAELSANHLGRQERAAFLVDRAAAIGADAVKFQTYDADRLVGNHSLKIEDGPWAGLNMRALYHTAATPREWLPDLFALARERGIIPFSSPFSPEDVDFLEEVLDCPMYKIASFEITDLQLIKHAARTKKPLVLSTGMATLGEIEDAVDAALNGGAPKVTILKCTSAYPTPIAEANLATLVALKDHFSYDPWLSVGLSDHSLGSTLSNAAIALGAVMVEKHLTLSRADGGPDAAFSADPAEFEALVKAGRETAAALGSVAYGPTESEVPQRRLRRALWVVADVKAGEEFNRKNLRSARPCPLPEVGLLPIERFLGKRAILPIKAGSLFSPEMAE